MKLNMVGKSIQPRGANAMRHGSPVAGLVFFDDTSNMALKNAEAPVISSQGLRMSMQSMPIPRAPAAQGIEVRKAYKTATEGMWNKPGFSYSLIDRLELEAELRAK